MIKCCHIVFSQCPFRKTCGETAEYTEGSECDKFGQKIMKSPMTNAEFIRSMSAEQIKKWLESPTETKKSCKVCNGVISISGWGCAEKQFNRPVYYKDRPIRVGKTTVKVFEPVIEGDFKYCPECGRPLTKGKKQNDEHE